MKDKPNIENLILMVRNLIGGKSDGKSVVMKLKAELPKIKANGDQLEADCRTLQEAEKDESSRSSD